MLKRFFCSLFLAGCIVGAAQAATLNLEALDAHTIIGGSSSENTAQNTTSPISADSTYSTLLTQFATTNVWYVSSNHNTNVSEGYKSGNPTGIILIAGGPANAGTSANGGIKFTISQDMLAGCTGTLSFTFDLKLTTQGNNNQNHEFTFSLMSAESTKIVSSVYNSKTGDNVLTTENTTVSLTFSADQVTSMKNSGSDTELVFLVSTNAITGSNKGIVMSNFQMSGDGFNVIPEPATAGLSLLGLSALATRRRRA